MLVGFGTFTCVGVNWELWEVTQGTEILITKKQVCHENLHTNVNCGDYMENSCQVSQITVLSPETCNRV